ncbi:MCE family protein [Gordonia jinghuaiqii]|uniref:MCE family protein n=1 Tax=Gordonia jinghuaiqii TaxID=2758710 RepID=A0A7D7LVN7_9ACTN|nr:MlaD family protein [Gordonia jinghuaiqii]MCR5979249.1 MCE family protein [Gordonia jinghuaiqii]QMT01039.1 MCE family protein [Gordonia jinghuaiqii]
MPGQLRRGAARVRNSDLLKGLIAVVVAAVLVATVGILYMNPPNTKTVSFMTKDAISVRGGEDVRVAGISVGKVESVELGDDAVEVGLQIGSDTRIGDESRVEVRLLTAVGGYFVTLIPLGETVSGNTVIPLERVTVPYTIADTLQELPRVTDNTEGVPVEATLDELSRGLGSHPDGIRDAVAGMQTIARVVDRQKKQVESILSMVGRYSATFDESRAFVSSLIDKANILISTFHIHRVGFNEAYFYLGNVLSRLGPIGRFYMNHRHQVADAVQKTRDLAGGLRDEMGGLIGNLETARDQLMRLVEPVDVAVRGGQFEIDASNLCLPVRGRQC